MVEIELDVASFERLFRMLDDFGDNGVRVAMESVAVRSREHAEELINRVIYATPPRGGYERTGRLRSGINVFVQDEAGGPVLYIVTQAVNERGTDYAPFNELGTYGNRLTAEQILEMARQRVPAALVVLEFGRVDKGLEPRSWLYPTAAFAEYILPQEVADALLAEVARLG